MNRRDFWMTTAGGAAALLWPFKPPLQSIEWREERYTVLSPDDRDEDWGTNWALQHWAVESPYQGNELVIIRCVSKPVRNDAVKRACDVRLVATTYWYDHQNARRAAVLWNRFEMSDQMAESFGAVS